MSKKGLFVCAIVFLGALFLFGCDASNAASGYGGGAVGNTPPNPFHASGGNAYSDTGDATANGPSADTQVGGAH